MIKNKWIKTAGMMFALCICMIGIRGQALALEKEHLTITREMDEAAFRTLEAPPKEYQDENGVCYELFSWNVESVPGKTVKEEIEKQILYEGVEGAQTIPWSISVKEEVSGQEARGALNKVTQNITGEWWEEDFSAQVTFHAYGSDEYQLGNRMIKGENALEEAAMAGDELLNELGLSEEDYKIHSLIWNGEVFADENGQLCRQALALGEKKLRNYEVVYQGNAEWAEPDTYKLQAEYVPLPEVLPEEEGAPVQAAELKEEVQSPQPSDPLWYWVRNGVTITIAAGLIGLCVGLLLLFISWLRKRKRDEWQRQRITMKQ